MKGLSFHLFSLTLTASLLFLFAGAGVCEEKPISYTNEDIEKYRQPSDNRPQERRKTELSEKNSKNRNAREKQEQEYWCKRATMAKKKIESAGRDVRQWEEEIAQEQSKSVRTSRKMNTLQSKLKKAKDRLSSAESDLGDIEDEAHRNDIRPGWLRCQFD